MKPIPLSRRSFLAGGVQLSVIGSLAPSILDSRLLDACLMGATLQDEAKADRILVVVQLSGGNDGLNTVIPFSQDAYYRTRPTLGQKVGAIHRLDEHVALHPALGGLAELYQEDSLSIIHGVGHPGSDRSHFRSMEIWHTAEPFQPVGRVGWLGNMADQLLAKSPGSLPALSVGGRGSVLSMRGAKAVPPTVPNDRGFRLAQTSKQLARERDMIVAPKRKAAGDLAFLRSAARTAYNAAERMSKATSAKTKAQFPGTPLAKELRLVAQLIRGGFGTRIFHVSLGGFDTHASQASVHGALLTQLGAALTAFQRDLQAAGQADRVVTMIFSEFGRRVAENGSRGTDHGRGNPVLLLGPKVAGRQHGTRPDLGDLVDGDIPSTTDFRGIYASLERGWMGLKPFSKAQIGGPKLF